MNSGKPNPQTHFFGQYHDERLFLYGLNPEFWKEVNYKPTKKWQMKKEFKEIIHKNRLDSTKNNLKIQLQNKFDELINFDNIGCYKMKEFQL